MQYGLRHRARPPVHAIGTDEVSRRKGQVYLTVVYDLERRVLLWVGEDRTEEAVKKFFTAMGCRRCRTLRVVCIDMWAPVRQARARPRFFRQAKTDAWKSMSAYTHSWLRQLVRQFTKERVQSRSEQLQD